MRNRISNWVDEYSARNVSLVVLAVTSLTATFAAGDPAREPEQISLEKADKSKPERDCLAAIKHGDWRFLMMSPRLHESGYPGVPAYAEHLVREKGAKIIKEASGFFGPEEVSRLDLKAEIYAQKYNTFLLKQIPNSDQPEPGYGIPGPDDVVKKGTELTTANLAQGRDLRLYDDGGHFDCRRWALPKNTKPHCHVPEVRAFIWHHWQRKHRGYICVTTNSPDWVGTTHIFIEPDTNGVWHILVRVVARGIRDLPAAASLTRVKHTKFDEPGGAYALSFRALDGSEVGRL
jgi:hypothetical protein